MDKILDLGFQYGPIVAVLVLIILGLVWLVSWFIKREVAAYELRMAAVKKEITMCEKLLKTASSEFIAHVKTSISELKTEISLAKTSVGELRSQITKEMLELRAHSLDAQKKNDESKKSMNEILGKVVVIEKQQSEYNLIFKKIIDKSKGAT